jgi:hypothetical protein
VCTLLNESACFCGVLGQSLRIRVLRSLDTGLSNVKAKTNISKQALFKILL